ncbi:hypothetical protein SDC9_183894 [bioreactor metagenome]|uniref:Uncharacterized protein n=1 Tax=bioreactor metagenome TaxID=1076179 RepID=A0A645HBI1_9ZZZZ
MFLTTTIESLDFFSIVLVVPDFALQPKSRSIVAAEITHMLKSFFIFTPPFRNITTVFNALGCIEFSSRKTFISLKTANIYKLKIPKPPKLAVAQTVGGS